jgi:hypothetical protein
MLCNCTTGCYLRETAAQAAAATQAAVTSAAAATAAAAVATKPSKLSRAGASVEEFFSPLRRPLPPVPPLQHQLQQQQQLQEQAQQQAQLRNKLSAGDRLCLSSPVLYELALKEGASSNAAVASAAATAAAATALMRKWCAGSADLVATVSSVLITGIDEATAEELPPWLEALRSWLSIADGLALQRVAAVRTSGLSVLMHLTTACSSIAQLLCSCCALCSA